MVSLRVAKCYFIIGNIVFKQEFVISMGIDPAPHWANLFLYFLKSKYVQQLISKGSPRAFKVPWDINVYRQPLHNKWWWWVFFLSPRAFKVPWDIRFAERLLYKKWWWWVFFFTQIWLPQAIRKKTWTSRGTCNILGFWNTNSG